MTNRTDSIRFETIDRIARAFIDGGVTEVTDAIRNDICDQVGDDMLGDDIADRIHDLLTR